MAARRRAAATGSAALADAVASKSTAAVTSTPLASAARGQDHRVLAQLLADRRAGPGACRGAGMSYDLHYVYLPTAVTTRTLRLSGISFQASTCRLGSAARRKRASCVAQRRRHQQHRRLARGLLAPRCLGRRAVAAAPPVRAPDPGWWSWRRASREQSLEIRLEGDDGQLGGDAGDVLHDLAPESDADAGLQHRRRPASAAHARPASR